MGLFSKTHKYTYTFKGQGIGGNYLDVISAVRTVAQQDLGMNFIIDRYEEFQGSQELNFNIPLSDGGKFETIIYPDFIVTTIKTKSDVTEDQWKAALDKAYSVILTDRDIYCQILRGVA